MKLILKVLAAALLCFSSSSWAAETAPAAPAKKAKNWTAPAARIRAQALADEVMARHPELISVTFHGVPPGLDKVYTMFAGSFPDRIGNPDDPDDIDVITKGITIVDPRWKRVNDPVKKFVMMLPLRDAQGENVGLLVLAYKNPSPAAKSETDFFVAASAIRDVLKKQIPSYADLFEPAN
jgi:hypothetical protein